jgi:hypothetical protein
MNHQEPAMKTPMFDPEALATMVANATARQGETLRKGVAQATLAALQGRELTLKNIKSALESVAKAASLGAARNNAGTAADELLAKAVQGMDDALLKAVQAQQMALDKLLAQGADLRDKPMQKALSELEKMEDAALATLTKVAGGAAGGPVAAAWAPVLEKLKESGLAAGGLASGSAGQIAAQWQEQMAQAHTMMKAQRAAAVRATQAMAESFGTLAGGVLIGLAEALQQGGRKKG